MIYGVEATMNKRDRHNRTVDGLHATDCAFCAAVERDEMHKRPSKPPALSWIQRIENLRPGEPCEFRDRTSPVWRFGFVAHNGGAALWAVIEPETGERLWRYIEEIRCVEQTDAWPGR